MPINYKNLYQDKLVFICFQGTTMPRVYCKGYIIDEDDLVLIIRNISFNTIVTISKNSIINIDESRPKKSIVEVSNG